MMITYILGYCVCPGTVILGPWVSYQQYNHIFVNSRKTTKNYNKRVQHPQSAIQSCQTATKLFILINRENIKV